MNRKGFIYKYTYPNGKVYIGQTRVSVEERHKQHMWASKHDDDRRCLCEVAIAKYGEPIVETIETIEVDDTNPTLLCKLLDEAEMKWIQEYDSTNTANGYNVMGGGQHKTPKKFILEEKYNEIWEKGEYIKDIENIWSILYDIGDKLCNTNKPLNKKEKQVWYKTRFNSPYFDYTNFCGLYNSVLNKGDMIIFMGLEELFIANDEELNSQDTFNKIMDRAINQYAQYMRRKVWESVEKYRDKYIKDWYINENTL